MAHEAGVSNLKITITEPTVDDQQNFRVSADGIMEPIKFAVIKGMIDADEILEIR